MIPIHDSPSGATFTVKIQPGAKKNRQGGELGDALKISLTALPIEGRANRACIDFLAKLLALPPSSITIAAGLRSRNKLIRVRGLTAQLVRDRLHL